jgi:nitronate monooxygenase
MPAQSNFLQQLQLQHPIIQAPLAGGGDTPELVAAVGNAGALGFIGAAYLDPTQIQQAAQAVRAKTSRPFGINLFAPQAAPEIPTNLGTALERLAPYFAELGLPGPSLPAKPHNNFDEQLRAALESGASVFSFTFGVIPADGWHRNHRRRGRHSGESRGGRRRDARQRVRRPSRYVHRRFRERNGRDHFAGPPSG